MIPGTPVGISQLISAALFLICSVVVIVRTSMAKKRAALRKRRREQDYEAQERAAREAEAEETTEIGCVLNVHFPKGLDIRKMKLSQMPGGMFGTRKPYLGKIKGHRKKMALPDKDTAFSEESSISENSDPEAGSSPEEMEEFFKTEGKENEENTEESLFTGEEAGTSVLSSRRFQRKMNGCIASREDLQRNLPMSRKIDRLLSNYQKIVSAK